ncbi:DUF2335 domain-containing protein [Cutibacterium granulosum]|nr:DUF2335 domain-containing protein [Cutibacterium granulosum]
MGAGGQTPVPSDGRDAVPELHDATLVRALSFQGPLPPPEILAGYNDLDESYADRIFHMAEQSHEAEVEAARARTEYQRENTRLVKLGTQVGIWTHAAVTVTCLGLVIFAVVTGRWAVAGVSAALPLAEAAVRLIQAVHDGDDN